MTNGLKAMVRLENAAILAAIVLAYYTLDYRWWLFAVLFLVPDLTMLGYLAGRHAGAIIYNIGHSWLLPASLAVAALVLPGTYYFEYLLIWGAHIALDRMLGYGLKSFDGFGHTHLGPIGKAAKAYSPSTSRME